MQNQIENNGSEDDELVDTLYIGNEGIKVAIKKLKVELSHARLNKTVNDSKGIEETIESNKL